MNHYLVDLVDIYEHEVLTVRPAAFTISSLLRLDLGAWVIRGGSQVLGLLEDARLIDFLNGDGGQSAVYITFKAQNLNIALLALARIPGGVDLLQDLSAMPQLGVQAIIAKVGCDVDRMLVRNIAGILVLRHHT
eukprot:CAMPEP_0170510362 /NCGR_PEP_ID=MMETSP0208-20121228/65719_2 /TAXON_ID=197538 /ORGANISM="Strombidium inclinatum, Strain S3" /LENGTH=133 /DNA_ID=CAMNT_0010793817 /DNA_START=5039 /DNA_END=5441 /DNA_ORIENTATION=-